MNLLKSLIAWIVIEREQYNMNDNEKKKLQEYIDGLRDEMDYWTVSSEAYDAIDCILRKMENLIEK